MKEEGIVFPLYLERKRLGGRKRNTPLTVEELTNLDLEAVNLEIDRTWNLPPYNRYRGSGEPNEDTEEK